MFLFDCEIILSRFVISRKGVMVTIMTERKTQRCQKKTENLKALDHSPNRPRDDSEECA